MKRPRLQSFVPALHLGLLLAATLCSNAQCGNPAPHTAQQTSTLHPDPTPDPIPKPSPDPREDQRLQTLAAGLDSAQAQINTLRLEIRALRLELDGARHNPTLSSAPTSVPEAPDLDRLSEDQEVLAAEVRQHEQTKVESESKFPLRITGLILFNTFVNQGVVDQIDLPTSALRRSPGVSHGSVGGSIRQTWIGLEGRGPVLGPLHTSARVDVDLFGNTTYGLSSSPSGTVRLRTAALRAETASDLFEARFDEPLISPLSPTSLANVAQPALAWTGNLWTWAPELRWKHTLPVRHTLSFESEAGLRDPYLAGNASEAITRLPSPAELSRRPAFEGRLSVGSAKRTSPRYGTDALVASSGWRVGGGGYFARQIYTPEHSVATWAVTADWDLPLQPWLRLSGEAYRGTGLGGLGGGAYRDVVQGTDRVTGLDRTIGLDAAGGWLQLQANPTPRLQLNAALGQDAGSGTELRFLILPPPSSPLAFYARNRAITANLVYRPWSSIILSPEFRRLISWPISGSANVANVFTLSAGYQF